MPITVNLAKEYDRVEGIRLLQERLINREYLRFTARLSRPEVIEQFKAVLDEGKSLEPLLQTIDNHIEQLSNVLADTFIDAARREAKIWADRLAKVAKAEFDVTNEQVTEFLRSSRRNFIQNLSRQQRAAIRQIMISGLQRSKTTDQLARSIAAVIGLAPKHEQMIESYRRSLEQGNRSALDRELRNPRFDGRVTTAVEEDAPLTAKQVDRMVEAYARNLKRHRARVIAQTESLRMTNQARREAVRQTAVIAGFDLTKSTKTWQTTLDGRERPTHRALDGQTVGMDEPFTSPSGARLMHPGDTSLGAPAEELVNCRCSIIYNLEE